MKAKFMLLTATLTLGITLLSGCTKAPVATTASSQVDTVSSPSRANDVAAFEKAISEDGYFMVIVEKDLTFTKDLTVNGNMTKPGKTEFTRALAFATQNTDKTIKDRFTVTVPNLVINSQNTLIEYGIVKGDVYVTSIGFRTSDAKIDGNLYFATQELMDAFTKDDKTVITGTIAVKAYTNNN